MARHKQQAPAGQGGEVRSTYARHPARRYLRLLWLLLLIPLVYFVVQVVLILMPRMRTELALQEVMTDSLEVTGFVSQQKIPVLKEGAGGVLYYSVPAGQRVSSGAPVAELYATTAAAEARASLERTRHELALLESAARTGSDSSDVEIYRKQVQDGVYTLLDNIGTRDFSQLEDARADLALAANKLQVATSSDAVDFSARIGNLQAQCAAYEAAAVPQGQITASETGFFVPATKYDRIIPAYEALNAMNPAALQQALAAPGSYYGDDMAGHIILDYKWYFFAVVTEKEAEKFREGDKTLQIVFPDVSDVALPVTVQEVVLDEETGLARIKLFCERTNPDVLQLDVEKAQIIFRTEKGIRVPHEALRIQDGVRGVYIRFGNVAFFRPIEILLQDEHYMLVSGVYQKGVNELQLYDEIIVDSGGVDLSDGKYL